MKKTSILLLLILCIIQKNSFSKGGAIGLQLGKITFGLGGSSKGPILGIGPSPDNNLAIMTPIIPGDRCCKCENCCR